MTNITDALDSYLTAKAKANKWEKEFVLNWYDPLFKMYSEMAMKMVRENPNIDQEILNQRLSPEAQQRLRGNNGTI